jgi:hypothetical protein
VIRHPHQRQLDLQRRRAQQARQLRLRADLVGHQVEQPDAQRPDILPDGVGLAHHVDAFGLERGSGGQVVRDLDRHVASSSVREPTRVA